MVRYVLGVFAVILILIIIVVLLFRVTGSDNETEQTVSQQVVLTNYENTPAVAQWTVQGPVTAEEERRSIVVSVSAQERVFEIIDGYQGSVSSRQTFTNNQAAFKTFLSALQNAGFSSQKESRITNEQGACPLGRQFIYLLQNGSEQVLRSWGTSFSRRDGSFAGNANTVRTLFQLQIPGYNDLAEDVNL